MTKRIVKDGKHICAGFEVETENGRIRHIWGGSGAMCSIYWKNPRGGYDQCTALTMDAFRAGYNRGIYVVK